MSLRINDEAPNFTAETTHGKIDFHQWIGDGYAILFSHPKDFTPVCTTELGYLAKLAPEFAKRNTKVIGLSVDPVTNHEKWAADIEETQGSKVGYPIIGDTKLEVAKLYDRCEQRDGAYRVRHRTRQENQAHTRVSNEHRPQLRRSATRARLDPTHGATQGGHARELEEWR
jgi:alkyl hydroperoxide reductase subunit AhpC